MSGAWFQFWVERQGLDPAAWTAGHALQMLLGDDAPTRVGRAELWELSASRAGDDPRTRFEAWARASNLFLNPNRDRAFLLDGTPPESGPATAFVVVRERGAGEARAHALTLGHALGGRWHVRRGLVWSLVWPAERAAECAALAARAAWTRRRHDGLLVNPASQEARVLVGEWACPALPEDEVTAARAAEGEGDGGVA